ncbi:hypothetical protein Sjap_016417 [Stephania japonica]|uniref:DNA polymerase alpha subunit B n=1 Tax=Stephania japonica TaxID=461633 RepID=A0AAP0ILJ3_9MAGN
MEEEILEAFEKTGFSLDEEDEILKKCLTLCINYKLGPSDLASSFEVYFLNRGIDGTVVQNAHMEGFLLYLQNEQKNAMIKEEAHPHIYSSNDVDMILNNEQEDAKETIVGTPIKEQEKLYSETSDLELGENGTTSGKQSRVATNHITPFGQRTNKFTVQFTLNKLSDMDGDIKKQEAVDNEDDIIRRIQPSEACSFEVQGSQPEHSCRFMYDSVEDKFNALDNRIKRHAAAFIASGLHEEPGDPTVASQKSVFSVGMVCCDGDGHLNEKSILLQGSVEYSGGQQVRLDIQKLPKFSFFPGQVVGIEGHNPSGHCFIASKVTDSIPFLATPDVDLPPAKRQATDQELHPINSSNAPGKLSLLIASGPFTTTDNLLYEPLAELLAYSSRMQPQLLVLMGPFVDSEHPEIKIGTVDRSFNSIFHMEVVRKLQDHVNYMGSTARVVLVPSIRDAGHDFVFPQYLSMLKLIFFLLIQIMSLQNPGTFDANQVKVGCCTVDILKQLSGEEISRIPDRSSRDRLGRLATHLLSQRSFYPLFPPSEDVPLDLSLAPKALQISSIPDLLILPSDLAPFVKVLSIDESSNGVEQVKCICVNPGRLAKGVGGGTFVELNFDVSNDRTNASIIRI